MVWTRRCDSSVSTLKTRAEDDGDVLCQAGARWEDINSTLREKGIPLFFPVSVVILTEEASAESIGPARSRTRRCE